VLEAISLCEKIAGKRLTWRYDPSNRAGDHIWWISDTRKFTAHYPGWHQQFDLRATLEQMLDQYAGRWA
jgi:CDP-paratose 2-epimerase